MQMQALSDYQAPIPTSHPQRKEVPVETQKCILAKAQEMELSGMKLRDL